MQGRIAAAKRRQAPRLADQGDQARQGGKGAKEAAEALVEAEAENRALRAQLEERG